MIYILSVFSGEKSEIAKRENCERLGKTGSTEESRPAVACFLLSLSSASSPPPTPLLPSLERGNLLEKTTGMSFSLWMFYGNPMLNEEKSCLVFPKIDILFFIIEKVGFIARFL